MAHINWKLLNLAFWLELALAYFLPFQGTAETLGRQAGFPLPFLTLYGGPPRASLFLSMHCNPLGLLFDGAVLYLALSAGAKAWRKLGQSRRSRP